MKKKGEKERISKKKRDLGESVLWIVRYHFGVSTLSPPPLSSPLSSPFPCHSLCGRERGETVRSGGRERDCLISFAQFAGLSREFAFFRFRQTEERERERERNNRREREWMKMRKRRKIRERERERERKRKRNQYFLDDNHPLPLVLIKRKEMRKSKSQ